MSFRHPQPPISSNAVILIVCFFAFSTPTQAQVTGSFGDATWIHNPGVTGLAGGHTVSATAYNYSQEQWELPVKASAWAFDGNVGATNGTLIHSGTASDVGDYHSYADLAGATLSTAGSAWTINLQLRGDYKWIGDKATAESPEGLKARYVVYFGQYNTGNHWAFNIASGTGLSPTFSTNGVKLYEDSTVPGQTPPYGTGVEVTRDQAISESLYTGYNNEVATTQLTARTLYNQAAQIYQLEFRYDFSTGPITADILNNLNYLYVGAAISNPSSTAVLFANDHFTRLGNTSPEYDTIKILLNPVPEPSTMMLVGAAAIGAFGWRRFRRLGGPRLSRRAA